MITKAGTSILVGSAAWAVARFFAPFPSHNEIMVFVLVSSPVVFHRLVAMYSLLCFTWPTGLMFLIVSGGRKKVDADDVPSEIRMPVYVKPELRKDISVVLGEVHKQRERGPVSEPSWCVIPEGGLYTGVAAVGSTGSGKTLCCLHPIAEQIFNWRRDSAEEKASGFVLEVKGDFCRHVQEILNAAGRGDDYVEIGPNSKWKYNPLNCNLSEDELANTIGDFIEQSFGESKEPFWRAAYTGMISNIIKVLTMVDHHATISQVYRFMADSKALEKKMEEAREVIAGNVFYVFTKAEYRAHAKPLAKYGAELDKATGTYAAPYSVGLDRYCQPQKFYSQARRKPVSFTEDRRGGTDSSQAMSRLECIEFDMKHVWDEIPDRVKGDIVISASNILKIFDEPFMRERFCPGLLDADVMPPFTELIESGKVIAMNFPSSTNPLISRLVGTIAKLDYQRSVLQRLERGGKYRPTMFLCDEVQYFLTVGHNKPVGDEKFLSVSRQAKCIPIMAFPSFSSLDVAVGSAWRSVIQSLKTKVILNISDDLTAKVCEELCGREYTWGENFNLGHQDGIGSGNGRKDNLSISANHHEELRARFLEKEFFEIPTGEAIVLLFDGQRSHEPCRVYLKPSFIPQEKRYTESAWSEAWRNHEQIV
jgi:hypothetical protein